MSTNMSTPSIAAAVQAALLQPETLVALAGALAPAVEARLTAAKRLKLTQGAVAAARPSSAAQQADAAALEIVSLREQVAALLVTVRELTQQLSKSQAQPRSRSRSPAQGAAAQVAQAAAPVAKKRAIKKTIV